METRAVVMSLCMQTCMIQMVVAGLQVCDPDHLSTHQLTGVLTGVLAARETMTLPAIHYADKFVQQ